MQSIEYIKYLYFLTKIKNLGNVRIKSLLNFCENPRDIFSLSGKELSNVEGINFATANEIIKTSKDLSGFEKDFETVLKKSESKKINILTLKDDDYPVNLRNIYDAPVILYYIGKLTKADKYSLSIVGTRYPSEYGQTVCKFITEEAAKYDIPVISGLARGIDSTAHKTSLENKNTTYAVLGCGVDIVYPRENKKLFESIIDCGAVISEFEIGSGPDKVNFPRRNRVISGISLGTLVIETGLKGGSLITAGFALDQNREVFAIPGNIFSKKSEGANALIRKGQAKLVSKIDDIFEELDNKLGDYINKAGKNFAENLKYELNIFEEKLINVLGVEPVHIDKISEVSGLSISECLVNLLSLEFKGLIRQTPGKYFIRLK